jgi:ADP-ribose pyrophosphatase YjhB (NUDIX family)
VLFFDEQDHVMLVVPSYKDYRDIPGGYLQPGETPTQAAARETREELGISPTIGRLLVVDWAPNQTEGDKLLFVFDGGVLSSEHRLARRIVHGHAARQGGTSRYLEHGQPC